MSAPAVALVGEAPGRREIQTGRPFVGPSGKILDYACAKGGVVRGEIAILNAAACGPIPSEAEGTKIAAVAACRPRLLTELARLQPKVILAIGSHALRALSPEGSAGVTALRGALLSLAPDVQPRAAFMSTFHPAHIMRGGNGEQDQPGGESSSAVDLLFYFFLYDLAKASRLAHGQVAPWEEDLDLFVTDAAGGLRRGVDGTPATPQEFIEGIDRVYAEACAEGFQACDVETDSKDSLRANLTAIAFATTLGALSATWAAWRSVPEALRIARLLLSDPHIHSVFHNRIYDTLVLPRHGLPVTNPVDDTLLAHHAAFPGLPHKLDQVATQFFISPPWKSEFRRGEKDQDSLILYNARDALATARLRPAIEKMIEAHRTQRVYEADRQQFSVATHMRKVGYYVDREEQARQSAQQHARLAYMREALIKDFATIEAPWRAALARIKAQVQRKKDPDSYLERVTLRTKEIEEREQRPNDVGPFKPKAKADLVALFEVLRIPITDYTPKGAPVTDKKAMESAAARHPLMRRLIHINDAHFLISSFIDGLPIMADGRVHPDWTPKISGRWGAGKAQNWPKFVQGWPPEKDEHGNIKTRPSGELVFPRENPRRQVCAPKAIDIIGLPATVVDPLVRLRALSGKSRHLVGADFAQLELRIAGFLACDEFLLSVFRERVDPHGAFARECFAPKFGDLEQEFYAKAKGLEGVTIKANLDKVEMDPTRRASLKTIANQWSRLRDLTKRAEYCGIYGGTAETVYESIVKDYPEVSLAALQTLIDKINDKMAGVVRWRNEQENYARIHREIREQLLGRVRLFPLGNFNPNVVYNFPIQAFAASLLAKGIFRFVAVTRPELLQLESLYRHGLLDAAWVGAHTHEWVAPVDVLLNGHDSLLVECDEDDSPAVCALLEAAMTQSLPMPDGEIMEFPAEAAIGRRWSDT